jgi:hypothetical protein
MRLTSAYSPFRDGLQVCFILSIYACICQGPGICQRSTTEFAGGAGAAVQARERKTSDLSTSLSLRKAEKGCRIVNTTVLEC